MSTGLEPAPIIISGGGKGGVAKSVTSMAVEATLIAMGYRPPLIIEFEAEPRLVRRYPEGQVRHFPVAREDLEKLEANPSLIYRNFDQAFDAAAEARAAHRPVVIDLAANADLGLASYLLGMGETFMKKGQGIVYMASTTANVDAITAAVQAAGSIYQALPEARVIGLMQDIQPSGSIDANDPLFQQFAKNLVQHADTTETHVVARLIAPTMWRYFDALNSTFVRMVSMDPQTMRAQLRMETTGEALRTIRRLAEFLVFHRDLLTRILGAGTTKV